MEMQWVFVREGEPFFCARNSVVAAGTVMGRGDGGAINVWEHGSSGVGKESCRWFSQSPPLSNSYLSLPPHT